MQFHLRLLSALEGVVIAFDAIRANKARAALTILGVAVGVFVVVVISAAIHGINASVAKDFESTGPTTFFVSRFPISFEACDGSGETCAWRRNPPLSLADARAIGALESVRTSGARLDMTRPVKYRDRTLPATNVIGFTSNWTVIDGGGDINPGRSFTEGEAVAGARVAVISTTAAENLFGESDPLDKDIDISGERFRVIGIYKYEASFLAGGDRPRIIVPVETARRTLNAPIWSLGIAVIPRGGVARDQAVDDVTALMRGRHALRPRADNDFAIITQDQLFDTYNKIFGMFFLVMISLSAVGLLVGGVGVVAIMMISVTERTREIGVRKALGATRATILWQFLVEAVTLTGIGAVIGLVVGMAVAWLIKSATPIAASVPPGAVVAALLASAITGIVFGMLPALRASRLDPVAALRYE
ncbi:MAG: ABC transporter permease [Gemmatimonadaceae bacterium]|nr:ABC transporter permease [Gemmatimonadaceae bacterium]